MIEKPIDLQEAIGILTNSLVQSASETGLMIATILTLLATKGVFTMDEFDSMRTKLQPDFDQRVAEKLFGNDDE